MPARPEVKVCGVGPALVRPASMILTCADDGMRAKHLTWSSWTSTRATASGTVTWLACASLCADSKHWDSTSANLTLTDPVAESARGVLFTRLELHVTGPTPAGFQREADFSEAPLTPAPAPSARALPRREVAAAPSGPLGYAQIEGFWDDAGGPSASVTVPGVGVYTQDQIAAAITGAEASFYPGIIQAGQPYITTGWGLWQITPGDSVPSQYGSDYQLLDPWNNAEGAVAKYNVQGFNAWTTYFDGAYLQYLQHTSADIQLTDPGEYVQINSAPSDTPAYPPPAPGSTYGPPMPGGGRGSLTDLFLYNPSTGASYTERASGSGGWIDSVAGPRFSTGWNVYPANLYGDGLTDLFLYNPSTGASYTERASGSGGWIDSVPGPRFSTGWNVYPATLYSGSLTDLFLYNPSTGASYTERASGSGGWIDPVAGPRFSTGWNIYPATLY
ncbi:MAG TPA: hypothetical protein VGS19_38515 [Streptosporangiaceae bacterium]|nr:hypothetical protein [Streptosporangiaceae bacterium]